MNTAGMIVKEGIKLMSNYGVGYIVGEGVKAITPENINTFQKVCVGIGGAAVAGYAGIKANAYIDEVADALEETIKNVKEMRKSKDNDVKVETIIKKSEEGKTTTEIAEELNIPERKATNKKKNTTKKKEEKVSEPKEESKIDEFKEA